MYDFNKYDDAMDVNRYEGFIDRDGYFYKVSLRGQKVVDENGVIRDSHNKWAEHFLREKMNIQDFKFNPTASALFTLTKLRGPAEILIHCFGYVYYSHDPYYFKPIIKVPNPKIANFKATKEQLDMLFSLMILNNENTNIGIFFDEEDDIDYLGQDDNENYKKI